jgi:hypothetical protein
MAALIRVTVATHPRRTLLLAGTKAGSVKIIMSDRENDSSLLHHRIHGELVDSLDEELELEIDDERLASLLADLEHHPVHETGLGYDELITSA